jgi:putative DNA primase/helicase
MKTSGNNISGGLYSTEPEPWPEPIDGSQLFDELAATFRRYLALPDGAAETLALWVVFTHAIDASAVAPRLAVLSPVPRCGKTTLIGLLIRLVRRPLPTSNITPAVVYRVIAKGDDPHTLLIDEADTFFDVRSELVGIINSGHSRDTAFTMRCAGDDHEPQRFGTYAAIAIAKIGKLPPALQDRSLVIRMQRRRPDEAIERFREDRAATDLLDLKRRVARWVADNRSLLKGADPDIPNSLNDRAADNWRTMLAIADIASGNWPDTARHVAVTISADEEDTTGWPVLLLQDIEEIFAGCGSDRLSSAEICQALARREDRPWARFEDGMTISAHRLASMLRPFGIHPKVIRINGGTGTPRGYMRAQFEDVWARDTPLANRNTATN